MFVAEQQFRGWRHGSWLVAMQAFDVFRPFPPLTVDVETEPAYPLRVSGAYREFDGVAIPVEIRVSSRTAWIRGLSSWRISCSPHRFWARRREDAAA